MSERSQSDHEAPTEVGLRNTNEQQQHVNEFDQSGLDEHKDKNAQSPSHEAQVEHGMRNEHEQVLIKDEVESHQDGSLSNEDYGEDQDEGMSNGNMNEDAAVRHIIRNLSDIRRKFECPICLGIIRQARAIKHCLHQFCKKCIEKALRVGKNECPVCLTHCPSRRSLRADRSIDSLISRLFPDVEKYDEKAMTLLEDEKIHITQIQASITETLHRQTEARKRKASAMAEASTSRLEGTGSSSNVEKTQFLLESATTDENGTADEIFPDVMSSYSIINSGENEHLHNSDVNADESEIHLVLVSLDEQRMPSLQEPYLCCKPTLSMKTLSKYVTLKLGLCANEIELCLVEEPRINVMKGERTIDPDKDKIRVLRDEETLAELYTRNAVSSGHLVLAYKMK